MAFSIPDKGTADNDIQSIIFKEYRDVLVAACADIDYVESGCAITGGADMTPAVASGVVVSNGVLRPVTAGDVTITTANATYSRLDLIVANTTGALLVRTGTAAAAPKPPARSTNDVVLGCVFVSANDTSIGTTQITDLRVIRANPTIKKCMVSDAANNATTTGVKITELDTPLVAGKYTFFYTIRYQSSVGTTGTNFGVNFTGSAPTTFAVTRRQVTTGGSAATANASQNIAAATGNIYEGAARRALSTTSPNLGPTVGVDLPNKDMMSIIEGFIDVPNAGNLELWHSSETAANTVVKAASTLIVEKFA